MRRARLKAPHSHSVAYYHCVSRVVNREFVFGEEEKEQFYRYMRMYEGLYQVRVASYCLMSNHFHILLEVPKRPEDSELFDDEGLITHVKKWQGDGAAANLRWELAHFRGQNNDQSAEELREKWFARMWDVSTFMKVLKQRFTQWFNRRYQRRGTLWEERFKSVLVEGKGPALRAMAAYIDLNPVRAGICKDPKDYRWSSYGEAVEDFLAGKAAKKNEAAPKSIEAIAWLDSFRGSIVGTAQEREAISLEDSLRCWRCFLFGIPETAREQSDEREKEKTGGRVFVFRSRISRDEALRVLEKGGRLEKADYLRCRVRYFVDGVAMGSRGFVDEVFETSKKLFHDKRKTGARPMKGMGRHPKPDRLYSLRQLGKDALH